MQLRDYQSRGLNEIRAHIRDGARSVLWQMPCGAGKTASTAHMLGSAASKGNRAWFVCHRRELVNQTHRAFCEHSVPHGIIAAGFDMASRRPVQICSVQTLARRLDRVAAPDLIVWDEVHHLASGSWSAIYKQFPKAVHIGLSATPIRLDGRGLAGYFDRMVLGPTVRELIDSGYLSHYRLFAPGGGPDLSGMHTRMGDYVRAEVVAVMDKPAITGDAVAHYRKLAMGRRAVAFCVSVEASMRVAQAFTSAGIPAEHVDADTPAEQRDGALRRLASGQLRVVCNVDLFGEGVDVPCIEAVIMLRPTQSLGMYMQQVGRGLRLAPGKTDCIILDHAGNAMRHGLPDDDREWSLTGDIEGKRSRQDTESAVRQCPSCFAVSPATYPACRECREPFPVKYRTVDEVEGELTEIEIAQARKVARIEQARARTRDELIQIGQDRGYKNPAGWAWKILSERKKRENRA